MKKFLLLNLLFFSCFLNGLTQEEQRPGEVFNDALFFYDSGDYEEALYLFKKLSEAYPDNGNIHYLLGMSYLNIPGKERKAVPHLEKAVTNTTQKYKGNNLNDKKAPHHAWFYLGRAYCMDNQLDKALESYNTFMDIRNFDEKYNLRITENEIHSCQRAKIIKDSPIKLEKHNLDQPINNMNANFHPVVTPDEKVMVYIERMKFYDAIMYSRKRDGKWDKPVNITAQIASDGDMIPTGISAEGTELLLVKEKTPENGDIYLSRLEGNFWSKAVELGKNINTIRNEDHASFSPDGRMLLFSSSRRGGYGNLDIYRSERMENGEWSEPENLGPVINTENDETSAFITIDNKHLYFSSNGHFNMGGFDIFFSEKTGEEWTNPLNIGYPLNTTGDNLFYQPVGKGNTGYISLIENEQDINNENIYRIEFVPLTKIPVNENPLQERDLSLEITNPETGEVISVSYDRMKKEFIIKSKHDINYKLEVSDE